MRQMNFDVPLIQELGRSRRLPHTIGVVHLALRLAEKALLRPKETKALVAAAMLHDAAIPPYGHLVESEFKNRRPDFRHEKRVEELILGKGNKPENRFLEIIPGKHLQVPDILAEFNINPRDVINLICPEENKRSPIAADIDLDNIDNVHRMAAMLGWRSAWDNFDTILENSYLDGLQSIRYSKEALEPLEKWLDFRQKIYTLIIAHPECIPYNCLQADLVRMAVDEEIIKPEDWFLSEPEFEEKLRNSTNDNIKALSQQLISGCEYQTVDYVWMKGFESNRKIHNAEICKYFSDNVPTRDDHGYFAWNEKGLIRRRVSVTGYGWSGCHIGDTSRSCMIALVKKTPGKGKWTKQDALSWRRSAVLAFTELFETNAVDIDFPENYTGEFTGNGNRTIEMDFQ
jgi:HD superfamily phosphohydrolase